MTPPAAFAAACAAAPLPPCVIDVEASGFGRGSYPIEIGWVLPDGRARCTLVRPAPGWTHWDARAERVHGIAQATLLAHGRAPGEVAALLDHDLAGRTVYSDGWGNDYTWLGVLFEAARRLPRFRLEPAARLLDETTLDLLGEAREQARDDLGLERHRASSDARVLQLALCRLAPPQPALVR